MNSPEHTSTKTAQLLIDDGGAPAQNSVRTSWFQPIRMKHAHRLGVRKTRDTTQKGTIQKKQKSLLQTMMSSFHDI